MGHESLHQFQRVNGVDVTARAALLQSMAFLRLSDPYRYSDSNDPQAMLGTFKNGNVEQQGQMFEDYLFARLSGGDPAPYQAIADYIKNNCGCAKGRVPIESCFSHLAFFFPLASSSGLFTLRGGMPTLGRHSALAKLENVAPVECRCR